MISIIAQDKVSKYLIRYFHLNQDPETGYYHLIGFDDVTHELVDLGVFNFYRQAIEVFATVDYNDNDIMYYRTHKKVIQIPDNITDERECIFIYGNIY